MATLLQFEGQPAIELPDDLLWTDEYDWAPIEQAVEYSITGALIRDEMPKREGRPMTLAAGDDWGWISRETLEQVYLLTLEPGARFNLTYRGRPYVVAFDHVNKALQARPVWDVSDPEAGDQYIPTLRFLILEITTETPT